VNDAEFSAGSAFPIVGRQITSSQLFIRSTTLNYFSISSTLIPTWLFCFITETTVTQT